MEDSETQAREKGWLPEEEFRAIEGNENKKWRSADDFMDRQSLFDKIDSQGKEIRTMKQAQQELVQHSRKMEEAAYNRARAELQAEKKQAVEEGDIAKVEQVRDKIDELDRAQTPKQPTRLQPPPEFVEWESNNSWYQTNVAMRTTADAFGNGLIAAGLPPQEVLKQVTQKMKELYPQNFRNPNKDSAPSVDGATRSRPSPNSKASDDLTDEERTVMNKLIRAGVPSRKDPKKTMTREEYIADLKAIKEQQ